MNSVINKLLMVICAAYSFVSCFPEAEYTHTAPVYATFEYSNPKFDIDTLFYKSDFGYGIGWEYIGFLHNVDTVTWVFNGGMLLSGKKGSLYESTDSVSMAKSDSLVYAQDRFRVNSVKDTTNNNNYLVFYQNPDRSLMPAHAIEFLASDFGTCQPVQCLVNNTAYVAYKVAQHFENGDRLTLKAIAYQKGAKVGEATINLADFSAQKDSIVSTWTPFDLSKLGAFDYIDFDVISTKEEVPAYFCMDYMIASVTVGSGM